jgi:hypothetical protein
MEFNQLVLDKLQLLLSINYFECVESRKNYVRLQSNMVTIVILYDKMEYENYFYIHRNDSKIKVDIEMTDDIFKNIFHFNFKTKGLTTEHFLNNLASFFQGEGNGLLIGDLENFEKLEEYWKEESIRYNKKFIKK